MQHVQYIFEGKISPVILISLEEWPYIPACHLNKDSASSSDGLIFSKLLFIYLFLNTVTDTVISRPMYYYV